MIPLTLILLEAFLWSLLWMIVVIISVRCFPFTIAHDFPKEVQEVAQLPRLSKKHKFQGILFGIFSFSILFGLLISFALIPYANRSISFQDVFIHLWIICMGWNILDLLIVDWLCICHLGLKYFVLPGTEGHPAHANYRFHLKGFFKGCIAMTIVALISSIITFALIYLIYLK